MQEKEYSITLTESDLDKLTRIVRHKLKEQSKDLIKNLEPLKQSVMYQLEENDLEVLHDSLEDTLYYLDICTKLAKSKYEYSAESN